MFNILDLFIGKLSNYFLLRFGVSKIDFASLLICLSVAVLEMELQATIPKIPYPTKTVIIKKSSLFLYIVN